MLKSFGVAAISALMITVAFDPNIVHSASNVDCNAVMNELHSGKYERQVSKDLKLSLYAVRRCKRHAKAAAKAANKSSLEARSGREMQPAHLSVLSSPSPAAVSSPR